jgi:catechol 2,3-dioxygenase-like lactoylglutathione lyase family enzyme
MLACGTMRSVTSMVVLRLAEYPNVVRLPPNASASSASLKTSPPIPSMTIAFYEAALKPLNIKFFMPYKGEDGHPDLWGFGDGKRAFFWIKQGKPDPAAIHWGFMAEAEDKVDEFYKAAILAGARDNISPRARLEYYPGYYAADVFDPDGYSFEVVHKS